MATSPQIRSPEHHEPSLDNSSLWEKFQKGKSVKNWTKDEALDIAHWTKQISSVLLGVILGIFGLTGMVALGIYCAIVSGLVILVIYRHLEISDDLLDRWTALKEGFPTGMSGFLICWILFYNIFHV